MELSKLIKVLELEFPPVTAWSEDSIGLQIKSSKSQIMNIYLTLELNESSIDEAIKNQSDLIITFHPLIFKPLSCIDNEERIGKLTTKLIQNNINLYAIHTNFDSHPKGTSYEFGERLGFQPSEFLVANQNYLERGMGVIINLDDGLELNDLLQKVTEICNSPIKYNLTSSSEINKIAILGGSGSNYIESAIEKNCQVIITADVKYHDFHRANGRIVIIDPGHYEMEQFVPSALYKILNRTIGSSINLIQSTELTNPVRYYPESNYIHKQINYLKN